MAVVAGASAAWLLDARAQEALPSIGFANAGSARGYARALSAFLEGLAETGYVEGRTVAIEYRWADGQSDRLPAMMADLVRRQVTVIVATSTPAALTAKAATTTIPIVFETGLDPVQLGLVTSLSRPGGNVTGVAQLAMAAATPKELELLHALVPTARVMALLVNPADRVLAETQSREALSAADALGLKVHTLNASTERDFDAVFASLTRLRAGGLIIGGDAFFTSRIGQLATLAIRHAVPAVYKGREFAAAGGLLAYGSDLAASYRLAGIYTGRILKGEKPANMPVQQPTKVQLYLNLRTAKALGLTIPQSIMLRADEVIE